MAQAQQVVPAEHPEHIQKFLFACAFWIVAADEQLTQGEQRWLTDQFGPRKVGLWLEEMTAATGPQFYQLFDKLNAGLGENERRRIYPVLTAWLQACAASDASGAAVEKEVIEKIKARISLDAQLSRLTQSYARQNAAAGAQPGQRPPPLPGTGSPSRTATPARPQATVSERRVAEQPRNPPPLPVRQSVSSETPEQEHPLAVSVPFRTFKGHRGAVASACFDLRGATAFSGSEDKTLRSWDVAAGVETRTFADQDAGVSAVACSPDGTCVYSGDSDGSVTGWKSGSGGRMWHTVVGQGECITSVAASGDGELVAVARDSGLITLLNAADGRDVRTIGGKGAAVRDLCMSQNGRLMFCGGDDKVVRSWDGASDAWTTFQGVHQGAVLAVGISHDGRVAASGSADSTVKLWDIQTGREMLSLTGHAAWVTGVDFSPDGHFIASADADGTVKVCEVATGRQVFTCRISTQPLRCIVFHPAGNSVLVCGSDHCLYHIENLNMPV